RCGSAAGDRPLRALPPLGRARLARLGTPLLLRPARAGARVRAPRPCPRGSMVRLGQLAASGRNLGPGPSAQGAVRRRSRAPGPRPRAAPPPPAGTSMIDVSLIVELDNCRLAGLTAGD